MTGTVRDHLLGWGLRAVYRIGWTLGPHLSTAAIRRLAGLGGLAAARFGGPTVAQVRVNLRGLTGTEPSAELVAATLSSWVRNFAEAFALRGWSRQQILHRVSARGDDRLRRVVAETGAVVALPHSGNWDLAGAWACLTDMPVVTVAEELTGPVAGEFAAFVGLREELGMTVLSHRDKQLVSKLIAFARPGRVICLVADRNLLGPGLPVRWGTRPGAPTARMPIGPALIARRAGVPLFPVVARYTERGIALTIGNPIPPQPGRVGLVAMTQCLADVFAHRLAQRPEDWHVMAPFFEPESPRVPGEARQGCPA